MDYSFIVISVPLLFIMCISFKIETQEKYQYMFTNVVNMYLFLICSERGLRYFGVCIDPGNHVPVEVGTYDPDKKKPTFNALSPLQVEGQHAQQQSK